MEEKGAGKPPGDIRRVPEGAVCTPKNEVRAPLIIITMNLYLVQHGEARSDAKDPERSLTDAGRDEVTRVARAAARIGIRPRRIIHSGKTRARQTSDIMAESLAPPQGVEQQQGLNPNDPVSPWRERLETSAEDLMIVGHLPFLDRLASLLLCGEEGRGVIRFRYGAAVCLARNNGQWSVCWILTPEAAYG